MKPVLGAALAALAILLPAAARALDDPPQAKASKESPKEQYQAALDDYQKDQSEFSKEYSKATTDAEQNKVFAEKYPNTAKYAERFWAIAEAAPDDPVAVDALVWCAQNGRGSPTAAKAIDRLAAKHAESPKIGLFAPMLAYEYGPKAEALLRTIVAKNPDRAARGRALLALGQWLNRHVELIRTLKDDPARREQMSVFLKAQGIDLDALAKADPDALAKEAEAAFDRVAKEFGDVSSGRGTLGKSAEGELNEIRLLGVGKTCPEIAGEDIDGKPFKLSDYKGKVVVVDFWGDW